MRDKLIIGTRSSELALWQAEHVAGVLRARHAGLAVELRRIATTGDKILDVPLAKIGGKGLFTKELETEMLSGGIDLAVHSLKDMPTALPDGLVLAAVTERADALDALVSPRYKTLNALPQGAKVGTSSLRRKAQLLAARPDLRVFDLRGNVGTRLKKLETEGFDAVVLAVAGLRRLGLGARITQEIPADVCLPAVGQGALAIEARADDAQALELVSCLHDEDTARAAAAERAFLAAVEGGCQVPVGVHAVCARGRLKARAVIATLDGSTVLRDEIEGAQEEAAALGVALASRLLAAGGREILAALSCAQNA